MLVSCDRRTPIGRRDFAVLSTLARLGLRAGEIAGFELGDFDWRAGEVVARGKGGRINYLPLPSDVGEAIGRFGGIVPSNDLADMKQAGVPAVFGPGARAEAMVATINRVVSETSS
jgi:integrase/recombinase XerD